MPSTITDRLNGLTTSVAVKAPCRVATTANITLSGTQTIDGVAVVAGDRVLVKNQTSAVDNGIWVCGAGTWARSTDFDGTFDGVGGTRVSVTSGTVNANSEWRTDGEGAIVIGTDSITWERATVSSASFIDTDNFDGSTIPDDSTVQEALQELETAVEAAQADIDVIYTDDYAVAVPGDYATVTAALAAYAQKSLGQRLVITVASGEISEPDDLLIDQPDAATRVKIIGQSLVSYTISSIGTATGATKNWSVPITLSDATGIAVNDYIRFEPSNISGTGRYQEICGVWKVTGVASNVVTIKHNHYAAAFPTMTLSGTCRKVPSVLRFPTGSRGICVESGAWLENLHWCQDWDASTDSSSDSADDGFQIGTAPDTTTTGLTQSYRLPGGQVFASNCSVSEFPGNGVQILSGKLVAVAFLSNGNGWRGFQAAEGGFAYNFGGCAAANAESNFETERGGALTLPTCYAYGGGAQDFYALSNATMQITNGYSGNAVGYNVDARKGAFIDFSTGTINNDDTGGVNADNARVELDTVSTLGGTTGWTATNGGFIDGHSASAPTATTPYSISPTTGGAIITATGALKLTTASVELESTGGTLYRRVISSTGDVNYQYNTGGGYATVWTMKSDGTYFPASTTPTLGRSANFVGNAYIQRQYYNSTVFDAFGSGSPEGVLTAGIGSTYRRTDGGAGTSFYIKESGTGNTGWVAK